MFIANLLLAITSIIALVLGLFIILSNSERPVNRALGLFILGNFIWLVTNLLTNVASDPQISLIFARLAIAGPVLLAYSFLIFCRIFTDESRYRAKWALRLAILPIGILLLMPTSLNISTTKAHGVDVVAGPLYSVLIPFLLIYFIWGFAILLNAYRHTNNNLLKIQIKYIFIGIALGFVPGLIANGVLPYLGYNTASFYGPNAVIFVTLFMAIAIAKHRFLDIRLLVARALVYVFSIAAVGIIYTLGIFAIGGTFFNIHQISLSQRSFFAFLALVIAVTFTPIIRFFNKLTNTLFFRSAYDIQLVLDKIGKIIIGNTSTHKLQRESLHVLEPALGSTYMAFLMLSAADTLHVQELHGQQWQSKSSHTLQSTLKRLGTKLTLYDELPESATKIKNVLHGEDISVVVPLVTQEKIIGYLVCGPKKSGNIYTGQDTRLLGIAANELAVALQNAQRFEEIQAFNETLQQKITDATKELKSTNRKLVELDEAKDEFISMASHQLRTPLTSIKGYISMLIEGDLGHLTGPQKTALKEAFTSSQRMVFLIADFLNVSRIKTGKFAIEPKEVNLSDMVLEELTQLKEMAESKHLKLLYDPPHKFPTVMLDDNKMHQVMMNIVDNAIYYTPANGSITIQLYQTGDEIIFKVVDTGIGVPKDEQHKLFTKFYRANNARKARPDGTGLGLYMAQKIIVEQGGSMVFESVEGKGSTFGFRFPLSKVKA